MKISSVAPQGVANRSVQHCVLVVEDELLIRYMLSDGIRFAGYRVIEACNADEALTLFVASPPDLIVTDIRMPGSIDGVGLVAVVRKTHPNLPVIIASSHLEGTSAILDAATHFVAKPYSMDEVATMVESELAKSQRAMIPRKREALLQSWRHKRRQ